MATIYAQLMRQSEEGNIYPETDMIAIDESLDGLLMLPNEYKPENTDGEVYFWQYYGNSAENMALSGSAMSIDNNRDF
jgi:hypothetical protein